MKILKFKDEKEWLDARLGRVTGTRLKDLIVKRGTGRKIGFYEILAERIALPPTNENILDRGHRLEKDAIARFSKETDKKVNDSLVMWCREDDDNIAISPDGFIGKTEAVEVKCLNSARHIEALLTQKIPNEYQDQVIQYFIVNDSLRKLYFVFYDPRIPKKDFFYIEVNRKDVQDKVDEYLLLEREILDEIKKLESELTF